MQTKSNILATSLAMFSMFFGAGNVVFPLALGRYAQDLNFFAILGLIITGVGVPFLGLTAMTLFNGNYRAFFERIGKIPGFLVILVMLSIIGPFGAIPRCITLSHATIKAYVPQLNLIAFSVLACLVIFLFTFRKNRVIDLLGYILTPVLLACLALIVIVGLWTAPPLIPSPHHPLTTFLHGLTEGYQLMDLIGAFFFSAMVLNILEQGLAQDDKSNYKKMIVLTLKASCISIFLLATSYIGFSYVAAHHSDALQGIGSEDIIAVLANHTLGPYAGLVACVAVAFACLTTAIALSVVFAEFLHEDVAREKIGYIPSLLITLGIAFLFSTLNFSGIVAFLAPILNVCYPALILLSALNILYKLFDFKPVKIPVWTLFIGTLIVYLIM